MTAKEFWKSKTFWFNVLALIVAVAGYFGFAGFEPDSDVLTLAAGIAAIINLILRSVTYQPIKIK